MGFCESMEMEVSADTKILYFTSSGMASVSFGFSQWIPSIMRMEFSFICTFFPNHNFLPCWKSKVGNSTS